MDGGSGHEFVLPHLSAADREGPNKALDGYATVPMKVMNGLVHGDTRSHVILSPGVIGATANLTCECLGIMINTAFEEHGMLPPVMTLQFDGASTNKCILTLAYISMYVMFKVFRTGRARCELENHAHDIYDAYQAVHAVQARRSTFFHLDELRAIIEAAHRASKDAQAMRPIAGHDVKVSNLWAVRDYWEWLCPGYTVESGRPHALANAAFTSYPALSKFRDFKMELEAGSTETNPKVGLWAKVYMTSPNYEYLGTIMTLESYRAVTRNMPPPLQARDVSEGKTQREEKVAKHLRSVSKGPLAQQFSQHRLSDALAMCERRWDHFQQSGGELLPSALRLPHELAEEVLRKRSAQLSTSSMQSESQSESQAANALQDQSATAFPQGVQQRHHVASEIYGFRRGGNVVAAPPVQNKAPSDQVFAARRVTPGSFVLTRPAQSSHWARAAPKLGKVDYWMWQISSIHIPGEVLPGTDTVLDEHIYVAHLFQPKRGCNVKSAWTPCWETSGPRFLRTSEEKHARHKQKMRQAIKNRFKKSKQSKKSIKSEQSKKSKESKKKSIKSEQLQVVAKGSENPQQRKKAKPSFMAIMDSWNKAAKARASDMEQAESVVTSTSAETTTPLQSFLRPANIIGGSFARTPTGRVPGFVHRYWSRHAQVA